MTEFEMKMSAAKKAVGLGKLSRRDFMSFAIASGMTIPAASMLFATAARAQPKQGGVFKAGIGHGQTTDSLDPATWSNGFTFSWGKSVMGAPLVQVNQKNEPFRTSPKASSRPMAPRSGSSRSARASPSTTARR
jgi:peptide/nickel transport system substrate-binding protein